MTNREISSFFWSDGSPLTFTAWFVVYLTFLIIGVSIIILTCISLYQYINEDQVPFSILEMIKMSAVIL